MEKDIIDQTVDFLQAYIDKVYDGNQTKAAQGLGVSYGLLRKWLLRERVPSLSSIAPIYQMMGVRLSPPNEEQMHQVLIPILKRKTGSSFGAIDETDGRMPFTPEQFMSFGVNKDDAALLNIADDAMAPDFRAGDLALVNQADKDLSEGRYYAMLISGALAIRLVQRGIGSTVLKATNPNFRTLEVADSQMNLVEVIGRVVMAVKKM